MHDLQVCINTSQLHCRLWCCLLEAAEQHATMEPHWWFSPHMSNTSRASYHFLIWPKLAVWIFAPKKFKATQIPLAIMQSHKGSGLGGTTSRESVGLFSFALLCIVPLSKVCPGRKSVFFVCFKVVDMFVSCCHASPFLVCSLMTHTLCSGRKPCLKLFYLHGVFHKADAEEFWKDRNINCRWGV